MAILVDELREYPDVPLRHTRWCHLATDGPFEELHAFAAGLGLRRAWFQGDHYDLPPHGRARAVELGAEEVATAELLERMTGPRGDRTRRRTLTPRGVVHVLGEDGPRVLRYPPGALVVVCGAGAATLAARAVDRDRVPLLVEGDEPPLREDALVAALTGGRGAVLVTTVMGPERRTRLAHLAHDSGCDMHLLLSGGDPVARPPSLEGLASVTVLDPAAAARLRRLRL